MSLRPQWLLAGLVVAVMIPANGLNSVAAATPPPKVDACKMIDVATVNAAATAWFGMPVKLTQDSAPGAVGGTCDFSTDAPKHIDISVFYAPHGNAAAYGLGLPTPAGETAVPGAGDRAVYDQDLAPTLRYKSENFAVLKGSAVLVLNVMLDKSLPFVAKEKLAEFANKNLVARM